MTPARALVEEPDAPRIKSGQSLLYCLLHDQSPNVTQHTRGSRRSEEEDVKHISLKCQDTRINRDKWLNTNTEVAYRKTVKDTKHR